MWSVESLQWWWIYTVYQHPIDGGWWIPDSQCDRQSVIGDRAGDCEDVEDGVE